MYQLPLPNSLLSLFHSMRTTRRGTQKRIDDDADHSDRIADSLAHELSTLPDERSPDRHRDSVLLFAEVTIFCGTDRKSRIIITSFQFLFVPRILDPAIDGVTQEKGRSGEGERDGGKNKKGQKCFRQFLSASPFF